MADSWLFASLKFDLQEIGPGHFLLGVLNDEERALKLKGGSDQLARVDPRRLEKDMEDILRGSAKRDANAPVFVCYRRSDNADTAGRVFDRLVGRFGPESVSRDHESIPLGSDFASHLEERVRACRVLMASSDLGGTNSSMAALA